MRAAEENKRGLTLKNDTCSGSDRVVFSSSIVYILPFYTLYAFNPDRLSRIVFNTLARITMVGGWFYLFGFKVFVLVGLLLAFPPLGSIRLDKDDKRPMFGILSRLAVLFWLEPL